MNNLMENSGNEEKQSKQNANYRKKVRKENFEQARKFTYDLYLHTLR